jgi:hypothetical protein
MKKMKENPLEHKTISPYTMEGYLYVQEKRKCSACQWPGTLKSSESRQCICQCLASCCSEPRRVTVILWCRLQRERWCPQHFVYLWVTYSVLFAREFSWPLEFSEALWFPSYCSSTLEPPVFFLWLCIVHPEHSSHGKDLHATPSCQSAVTSFVRLNIGDSVTFILHLLCLWGFLVCFSDLFEFC